MNELRLPPRRELPPEVRGRIRARVRAGLDAPRRTRLPRARAPFAVAAGVAVLAAGAMIVAQSVDGGAGEPGQRTTSPTSTAPRPLDLRAANGQLDRCWAAVQAEGKANRYPDRSRWRAVATGTYLWVQVTSAFADNKPIFCQTSVTTVRVSEPTATPAYTLGGNTAALFTSPEGVIAGVRDESWAGVGVFTGDGSSSSGTTADLLPHGLFVAVTRARIADSTTIDVDRWSNDRDRAEHPERWPLPRPAAPVSRVSPPVAPADRTSERGRWTAECLAKSHTPVVDADMWEPGAWVTVVGGRYIVLRAGQEFAYCFQDTIPSTKDGLPSATRWAFGKSADGRNELGRDRPQVLGSPEALGTSAGQRQFVTGALPESVTKLEIVQDGHQPIQADLLLGTFAALLPKPSDPSDSVKAYNATGDQIYAGTLY